MVRLLWKRFGGGKLSARVVAELKRLERIRPKVLSSVLLH
jgi:hypothetical protein